MSTPFEKATTEYKATKLADFENHCTNIFARTLPVLSATAQWNNGTDSYRSPYPEEWADFAGRLEIAQNLFGAETINILTQSGQVRVKERWPELAVAYKNSTGGQMAFDPAKMNWAAAKKAAEKHLDAFIELQRKIDARGGLTSAEAALLRAGLLTL